MTRSDFDRLLSSLKALSPMQLRRLRQHLDSEFAQPKKRRTAREAKRVQSAAPKRKSRRLDEFNRQLLAAGRLASLPDPALDIDDDSGDAPIPLPGEPLSETIIRERR